MIGRLNHVAIAVPDLKAATRSTATRSALRSPTRSTSPSMASPRCSSSYPIQDRIAGRARRELAHRRLPRAQSQCGSITLL